MSTAYSDKVFEFSDHPLEGSAVAGDIRIIQIGETCLDNGAFIEEHIQICHEITYIISGEGVLTDDKSSTKCMAGDFHVVSKGTKHGIFADANSRLRFIHFAFDFEGGIPQKIDEFYGQCKSVMLHDNGNIRMMLNLLVDEYFNNAEFSNIAKCSLAQMILVLIWRMINTPTKPYKPENDKEFIGSTVYNIIKYIDGNLSTKLTVSKIAEQFSYSTGYISQLFKSKTGVPLKEYIVAMKMRYAEVLIREGKSSLEEIAEITGYESIQSFSKTFKKYTGHTPGNLRNI